MPKDARVGRCRRGVRPDHIEVRIGLVEADLVEIGDRVHQGQPGEVLADPGREGVQQHRHSAGLALEGEAEGVVSQQPGRLGPVTGGLQVPDGVGGVAVVGEPSRGDPVELRDLCGDGTAEFQPRVTDGTYQAAFLTTKGGVVLFDAPPSIGRNLQRAIDEIASANGVSNKVTHIVYSHHHADHLGASSLFGRQVVRVGHAETKRLLARDNDPTRPVPDLTFETRRTLHVGGERIEPAWHGTNHTPDNIYIHLPNHGPVMGALGGRGMSKSGLVGGDEDFEA